MKVLYNDCYGGFSFSEEFLEELKRRHPEKEFKDYYHQGLRDDPDTIALFEEWGSKRSSGHFSKIELDEIPDGVEYDIREYDGQEGVSWTLPKDEIIQELVDIIKGRKRVEETSKFTRRLLEEDRTIRGLCMAIATESS